MVLFAPSFNSDKIDDVLVQLWQGYHGEVPRYPPSDCTPKNDSCSFSRYLLSAAQVSKRLFSRSLTTRFTRVMEVVKARRQTGEGTP
jgi:hypothetical protein